MRPQQRQDDLLRIATMAFVVAGLFFFVYAGWPISLHNWRVIQTYWWGQ